MAETGPLLEIQWVPLEVDGTLQAVNLRVAPASELAPGFLLVIFERTEAGPLTGRGLHAEPEPQAILRQLERELEVTRVRLRDTVEQYEANTEELKAGNEELQAMNEELRSASEELETSREELQSINEELTTVNQELKSKLEELSHANSDLYNLMASTAIATIFLDRELRIMRYTPSVVPLFRLIAGDIGRPLADLRHQLEYPQLTVDAEQVLEQLVPVEREVGAADGRWFLARLLPYRTLDDRLAGVLLTFVDVTESKRSREAVRASDQRMRLILESAKDYAIFTLDLDRLVSSWNSGAQALLGYTEAEICGQPGDILFTPERWHVRKDGSRFFGSGLTRPLRDGPAAGCSAPRRWRPSLTASATWSARRSMSPTAAAAAPSWRRPWPRRSRRASRPRPSVAPRTTSWPPCRTSCAPRSPRCWPPPSRCCAAATCRPSSARGWR